MNNLGFGIYIHWPFCLHKCPYCDFNSHVRKEIDYSKWEDAYLASIDFWAEYNSEKVVDSVYFGGGTPSTCPPHIIESILNRINNIWGLANAEITLEANPTSVDAGRFASYAASGVNRVSIGFQAFNDEDLKRLGRTHTVNESIDALETARKYFKRTNFDLIYARQHQSLKNWQEELKNALQINPTHLSLYQLTIEQGTRFADMYDRGKLLGLPDEELAHEMYTWTRDFMRSHGYLHYEVSNFAKPGDESQHNLIYWRYGDYLGIGPGAHGRITKNGFRQSTTQAILPEKWLSDPKLFHVEQLSRTESAEEYVIMGMRIETGVEFERLDQFGFHISASSLQRLKSEGLINQSNTHISATDRGRLVLNHVILTLLTE